MNAPRSPKPRERLTSLVSAGDLSGVRRFLESRPGDAVPRVLSRVAQETRASLMVLSFASMVLSKLT